MFFAFEEMIRNEYIHKDIFEFEGGGSVEQLKVVYHTSEKPWTEGDKRKVIWICHALTANSDAADWWPELVGDGKFFDTEKYFVVCVNMLGSAYGSSGPASTNPATGEPYYFDFPLISVRDIVRANALVRQHLGIETIDLMIGGSIGGFQSVEWAIMEPEKIRNLVLIACSCRATPWLTAWEESQRMALEADPTFRECASLKGGEAGLKCARSIALISYRTGSYQRYQGKKLADRFDAYSYYYLAKSVDSNNVGRNRGGCKAALAGIQARTVVIGIDSDCLFPTGEQKFLAENIPGAEYREITSRFGHDGFLLENEQLKAVIRPLMP